MGAGKVFCILGGIIAIVATFLFSFAAVGPAYFYTIGLFLNLTTWFSTGDILIIIMCVVFLILMIGGFLILGGVKVRALAIIGSIFAIVESVYFILTFYVFGIFSDIGQFSILFVAFSLVEGFVPVNVALGSVSLGTYLLLGGGVLGLIGGIMGPDDF
jgi:hypothetical protein